MNQNEQMKKLLNMITESAMPAAPQTPVTEEYSESPDFDSDVNQIVSSLEGIRDIIQGDSWPAWIDDTVQNYSADHVIQLNENLGQAIQTALDAINELYDAMTDLN